MVIMSKIHKLSIFVIIVLLLIMGVIAAARRVDTVKNESPQMIEACRNALSSDRPGYTFYKCDNNDVYQPLNYVRTESSHLPIIVYFDDGTNDMWCQMQQIGSNWVVTGTGSTLVAPCP